MKQTLMLFLLLSSSPAFAMSRYREPIRRFAAQSHPPITRVARPALPQHIHRSCSHQEKKDSEEISTYRQQLRLLQIQKTILLYSRPIVTVAGVASVNYGAPYFELSQGELIGTLMALATLNTAVFHTIDEKYNERIKDVKKRLRTIEDID